ncbi:MAG: prenyltransferase/squalene oxidase repeat-containing protein, partial [Armatimonadota bacterium]
MSDYLGFLEGVLRTGLEGLGPALKQAQVAFVLSRQCADGGFRGRLGASDLYYTDFAVRLLALVAPGTAQLSST